MPRIARRDAPGVIHHVMLRGIERRHIFRDDQDRADFVERLDRLVTELSFCCYAWALMPNHVHLALQTGPVSLSRLMARLGTGYARSFNLRHHRAGHLMQNRFKSRLVDQESDLAGLVIYIHTNPLRSGLVPDASNLEEFAWCGHGSLMGRRPIQAFESSARALSLFANDPKKARREIRRRTADAERGNRCAPGAFQDPNLQDAQALKLFSEEYQAKKAPLGARQSLDGLIAEVCQRLGADEGRVRAGRRGKVSSSARANIAYAAIHELGVSAPRVGEALGVSRSGISRAVDRVWRERASLGTE